MSPQGITMSSLPPPPVFVTRSSSRTRKMDSLSSKTKAAKAEYMKLLRKELGKEIGKDDFFNRVYQGSIPSLEDSKSTTPSLDDSTSELSTCPSYTLTDGTSDENNDATKNARARHRVSEIFRKPRRWREHATIDTIAERAEEELKLAEIPEMRRKAVEEATQFLEDFMRKNWESHFSEGGIKIHCDLTMEQVKSIGFLSQAEGSVECGKLFQAPVIHDDIAHGLWKELKGALPKSTTKLDGTVVTVTETKSSNEDDEQRARSPVSETARRARTLARSLSHGNIAMASSRSSSSSGMLPIAQEKTRSKSDVGISELVRADSVICTTCGSRAVGDSRRMEDGNVEQSDNVEEDNRETSRSRRLSQQVGRAFTSFKAGVGS